MSDIEVLIAPTFAAQHALAEHATGGHALDATPPGECEACDASYT